MGSPAIIPRNLEYSEQNSPHIDPFLKPHEIDRAPSKLTEDVSIDPNIPDITNWTTEDVFEYFSKHHPEAASILKEQVCLRNNKKNHYFQNFCYGKTLGFKLK